MSDNKKHLMRGRGKKYAQAFSQLESNRPYTVAEGFEALLEKLSFAKFDETVDAAFNLGVDPKHSDQMVRGAIVLPHGTGKSAKVAVIAKGDKAKEAEAAGADFVGAEDLIEKIQGGWSEFDKLIATPDLMAVVSKVARILGPKGLMPNPKLGTVTFDVTKAVEDQKKGKVEYRTEKTGIVHVILGKKSFGVEKLKENFAVIAGTLLKAKPSVSKGTYLKRVTISTTMSPGVTIDTQDVAAVSQ